MHFDLKYKDSQSKARAGELHTEHGVIETPIFMPVGTAGSVKGVHQHELSEDIEAQIILGNTYHLFLRPGLDVIEPAGGLHQFINWKKPILTDSGGYQVYSLSGARKITEEGVRFQSHIDGSYHFFTPERAIDIQRSIGADIIMAFDECTPYPCDYRYAKNSMHMTHRWLKRCFNQMDRTEPRYGHTQALFPIVQGSVYDDLRKESADTIAFHDAIGNAIGGLSVGEPSEELYAMTDTVCSILPEDKPRYLMGVGTPANILECIAMGVDMFDCVMPSRNARHGMLFTSEGIINIKNKKWEKDFSPLDPNGTSYVDTTYSKAYLRHLIRAKENLAIQIATIHNLSFYLWLVKEARKHILAGTFATWKNQMIPKLNNRL
ncbi:MAG: tRNA guanosine(34) transglycosylase Tgt [Crocinitomicaceae bacterium]|jgi:queuine tRNA-ribosyltransferase|nr:tRNA guanosine(34) transglycosylase Tgt [Crocinitomicaceae bacterium]MDG1035410.1 tRNA guanosine(34) transglycosylase Tgt [Crocinitomicaceae bacterium]MDG1741799.1 tRNA guanosine(34) transglycosylase Tgt [Crocinitomicaceae bacterium]